ncbi:MAG: DUF4394 domain-containing protein [Bryobacteraceae bacterium]
MSPDFITGIDIRQSNGKLYGMSTDRLSLLNHIYTIDPTTGTTTLVSTVSLALPPRSTVGNGIDFDPVEDRMHTVINFFGVSGGLETVGLTINVDTGETVQNGTISYASGDINAGCPPGGCWHGLYQ